MRVTKIISINAKTNKLVYETENEIITKQNERVYYAELKSNNMIILFGINNLIEVADTDKLIKQTLIESGFLQVNSNFLINTNFIKRIMIQEEKVELLNNILIPFSSEFKMNIENFLNSITIN